MRFEERLNYCSLVINIQVDEMHFLKTLLESLRNSSREGSRLLDAINAEHEIYLTLLKGRIPRKYARDKFCVVINIGLYAPRGKTLKRTIG